MAAPKKFGAFGGVFTPSVLTILGVIMYLRLPKVVGEAGLYAALGIVLVSHVVSITTGLSISSIATDKRVGAGGPYYVLSRSLGLPLGGTIGLALFVGLSFSISLYVIGFSESFLAYLQPHFPAIDLSTEESKLFWIRVCGTGTVIVLTIITFISTSLAIKMQYFILLAIALSLVSIFLGEPAPVAAPHFEAPATGESLAVLFGIFFPAVTGFTAGVNMSGDLKDPKKAIPLGTIGAIAGGLVVYVALTIYLAYRVPVQGLRGDSELLLHVSRWPELVVAGIWGATLSSALGSILGAPRILQSMSGDRVTPRFFAKGTGLTNEPRRALILACLVGECGVLIGELDAIARVVSMVFLALYGFINLSCAIESWVSPDFRPSFRIPRWIGIVGAFTCLVLMLELDPLAMAGSIVVMLLLFAFLSRRRLALDSGDAWEGVWSSLVRTGLRRLGAVETQLRNWKPNILAFTRTPRGETPALRELVVALIGQVGVATDVRLRGTLEEPDEGEPPEVPLGVFAQEVETSAPLETVAAMARYAGLGQMRPNTVAVPWELTDEAESFARLAGQLEESGHGLLVMRPGEELGPEAPIDLWWYDELGNLPFLVSVARLVSRSDEWRRHPVRVFLLTTDPAMDDLLAVEAREYVEQARLVASVEVRHVPPTVPRFQDVIAEVSEDAALTLVPLPETIRVGSFEPYRPLDALRGHVLGFRPEPLFERALRGGHKGSSVPPPAPGEEAGEERDVELVLPEHATLADLVAGLDVRARGAMARFFERAASRFYDTELASTLIGSLHVGRASMTGLEDEDGPDPAADAERLSAVRDWMVDVKAHLGGGAERLGELRRVALEVAAELLDPDAIVEHRGPVTIARRREDIAPREDDSPEVRRLKRRKRGGFFARGPVKFRVPADVLERWAHERLLAEAFAPTLRAALAHHHETQLELGRSVARLGRTLATVEPSDLPAAIEEARQDFDRLRTELRARRERALAQGMASVRKVVAAFAEVVDAIDVERAGRTHRVGRKGLTTIDAFSEPLQEWAARARLLSGRAVLGADLAVMMHEVRLGAHRLEQTLEDDVLGDTLGAARRLRTSLEKIAEEGAALEGMAREGHASWDPRADLDELSVAIADAADELPERFVTCGDDALLHVGKAHEIEEAEVLLRRGVELAARRELLVRVEEATTHAHAVSDDARRALEELGHMIAFQQRADRETDADALASSLERAIGIVDERLVGLEDAQQRLRAATREGMASFAKVANAYDLDAIRTAASGRLVRSARLVPTTEPRGGVRELWHGALGSLLYRRSRGLLVAMKLRSVSKRAAAQSELRELVQAATPRPEVLERLPAFYQQLFLGRGAPGGPFRVPRPSDTMRLPERGLVLVVGDPGSGKTSTVQQLAAAMSPPALVWVPSPEGGTVSVAELERALSHDSRWSSSSELFPRLVDGSLIVLDDLELWWERREGGLAVIDQLLSLVEQHGRRLRFLMSINEHAFDVLDRVSPLSASASMVLSCDPFSAEEIRHATLRRHRSTGMTFQIGAETEAALGEWDLARLFSAHFDTSKGNVGGALRSWLGHVERVDDEGNLHVVRPRQLDWSALDALDGDAKALLLQLVIHKEASEERLRRVLGRPTRVLTGMLRSLSAAGLVARHPTRGATLSPYLRHRVVNHFRSRGLL